jgi:hypothetical protein
MAGERFIDAACHGFEQTGFNGDASSSKLLKPFASNLRIWISHGCDDALNPRGNQRIGARRCAPLMTMGLKIEIDSAAASAGTRLLQGKDLSVLHAVKGVEAFADKLPTGIRNDRTNTCAGRSEAAAAAGKVQSPAHVLVVFCRVTHRSRNQPNLFCANQTLPRTTI